MPTKIVYVNLVLLVPEAGCSNVFGVQECLGFYGISQMSVLVIIADCTQLSTLAPTYLSRLLITSIPLQKRKYPIRPTLPVLLTP